MALLPLVLLPHQDVRDLPLRRIGNSFFPVVAGSFSACGASRDIDLARRVHQKMDVVRGAAGKYHADIFPDVNVFPRTK